MDTLTLGLEIAAIKETTRRLALWSLLIHAAGVVLFLAAASRPQPVQEDQYVITEITWMAESVTQFEVTQLKSVQPVSQPVAVEAVIQAEPKPNIPPRDNSLDLVQERLAALRADTQGRRQITAAASTPTETRPQLATIGSFSPAIQPKAQSLNRAVASPVQQMGELPKEKPSVVAAAATQLAPVKAQDVAAAAEEILPGVSLAGEVSDRMLMSYLTPEYPEWAKRDGVEVSVRLYFTVLPSGQVKENILVEHTSGFDDFDRRARNALAAWRFQSLPSGTASEQWGRIEFKYRLRDAG